jgi:hypothetical protein
MLWKSVQLSLYPQIIQFSYTMTLYENRQASSLNQHLQRRCHSGVTLSSTHCCSTPVGSTSCGKRRMSSVRDTAWSTQLLQCIWCVLRNRSIHRRWCRLWWVCASARTRSWCWRCTPGSGNWWFCRSWCRVAWLCACSHESFRTS